MNVSIRGKPFQKGVSGNPGGRPKKGTGFRKSESLAELLDAVLLLPSDDRRAALSTRLQEFIEEAGSTRVMEALCLELCVRVMALECIPHPAELLTRHDP